ncbi:hypothetical protein [Veillonella sp. VA139]|uniref:hypothetical protein n=1 Tax=Veillonella sp. VA139 TaxID=741830 RepID=UPI000F8D1F7E|nr:hypothetical protein [Veillonella sp. VA139]
MDEINKFAFMCEIVKTGNTIIEIDKFNSLYVYKLGEAYERYGEKIKANVLYNVGNRSNFFIGLSVEELIRTSSSLCEYYIVRKEY